MNPHIYDQVDGVIVLSKFHGEVLSKLDRYDGKLLYASNGIVPEEFPEPDESKRDPHAAIYAAAPNRGLDFLLDCWPAIRAAVPDATLRIYYSWVLTEKMLEKRPDPWFSELLARLRSKIAALKDSGVTLVGGVDHKTLNEAYRTSGVWTYPVGASGAGEDKTAGAFEEIFCISSLRAMASGCCPVIVPGGALPETCPFGSHVYDPRKYPDAVIKAMLEPQGRLQREEMRSWALKQNWDKSADEFIAAAKAENERITIFAGGFGRRFSAAGSSDGTPLGGSEEAVIALAKGLVKAGERVFVYAPLPEKGERLSRMVQVKRTDELDAELVDDGATWLDASTFDPAGPHGTLLAWRCPKLVPRLKGNGYPVILWLMDPEYRAQPCDYEEADDVVFLTEAHKDIIQRKDGYDQGGSTVHVGLPELPTLGSVKREPKSVMWATSPDRGLLEFLQEIWPAVLEKVPDAKLHIFYGLEPLERGGKKDLAEKIRAEIEKLQTVPVGQTPSVVYHGGVPDAELYEWYQRCSSIVAPSVGFEETQAITICKAMALGCWPIVNDIGSLPEVVHLCGGGSINWKLADGTNSNDHFVRLVVASMDGINVNLEKVAGEARSRFSTESMVEKMLKVIEGVR